MKAKLSMNVERMPFGLGVPTNWQGLLRGRICVDGVDGKAFSVEFVADRDDQFDADTIVAAFRHIGRAITPRPADPPILVPDGYDRRPGAVSRVG